MPSQSPHPDTTPVVRHVRSLANHPNQQMCRPSRNSPLAPAKGRVSVPAGERVPPQGGTSAASSIQGQNSTPSSSLNNCHVADITQRVASALSSTQRWSMNTPTAMWGSSCCSTPAPGGTSQPDPTHHIVSSPASGIPSTPTPLSPP